MDQLAWIWPVPVLVLAIWLMQQVRRDIRGRSRWLLYPVVGVLALLAVGGAAEAAVHGTEGGRALGAGELVDVGGHRLFITCAGTGSPTVVLEGGLGGGSAVARPTGVGRAISTYTLPIEGRDEWITAARRQA